MNPDERQRADESPSHVTSVSEDAADVLRRYR